MVELLRVLPARSTRDSTASTTANPFPNTRRARSRTGQALTEFALTVPFILLLLGVAIDFGRVYYFDLTLRDAAFAGARYGGMNPNDDTGIKNAALSAAPAGTLALTDVTVSGTAPRGQGQSLTVSVRYSFLPITPGVTNVTGGPVLLQRSQSDIIK